MTYSPKPGQGGLFKNDRKTEDKHPTMKGYVIAHRDIKDGERLDLAAWTKDGKDGKFFSLRMSDSNRPDEPATTRDDAPSNPDEDPIPF